MEIEQKDIEYINRAIELATQNVDSNKGGPFGAIIVKDDKIIAEASNSVLENNDPTAHAEINAIRQACSKLNSYDLSGCTIYSSCEPCPMCLSAIYWARIDKIYYSNTRNDAKEAGFDDNYIYEEISKPLHERKIPIIHINNCNSYKSFELWIKKEDKKTY